MYIEDIPHNNQFMKLHMRYMNSFNEVFVPIPMEVIISLDFMPIFGVHY